MKKVLSLIVRILEAKYFYISKQAIEVNTLALGSTGPWFESLSGMHKYKPRIGVHSKVNSRAAPSVELHRPVHDHNTGKNSGGRPIKKDKQ